MNKTKSTSTLREVPAEMCKQRGQQVPGTELEPAMGLAKKGEALSMGAQNTWLKISTFEEKRKL